MNNKDIAKQIEKELRPEQDWWSSGIDAAMRESAEKLLNLGMTQEEALNFISGIIGCVRGEYGD